ncbi:TetR/AcrR family transcriptional regulator C-terminal domain-containing protein [Nonomuraea sp. SYSU D8015]|uniref:TetR/AcrR family transcriptional regulator C-terminal domain-containing protein n=1 Tax=Nonomuraea sp. SYSU D8015 TaxID=2593644 RepID=UPI0016604E5F|nr:TetR/AcrR family transcriptional regulator C-terminal domain-containing protein [Nonomuraea sp. SYSU D8015]
MPAGVRVPAADPRRWREQLEDVTAGLRAALLAHPGMARVALDSPPGPEGRRVRNRLTAPTDEPRSPFTAPLDGPRSRFTSAPEARGGECFRFGLRLLLDGLAAALPEGVG